MVGGRRALLFEILGQTDPIASERDQKRKMTVFRQNLHLSQRKSATKFLMRKLSATKL